MWSSSKPGVHLPPPKGKGAPAFAAWDLEDLAISDSGAAVALAVSDADHDSATTESDPETERAERERQAAEAARLAQERALAEAYARGMADGRAEGECAATERLREAVSAAEQALVALRAGEERWAGGAIAQENICALAVAVARHIIARKVSADSKIVRELVRTAIAEFALDEPIRIRVHPEDLAAIEEVEEITEAIGSRVASWIADPTVARGGCLIEGRERIIDGRVDTGLERVYRRLSHTHA
jgi:flagellar biosynthesis/type III secretory pathway protein FliH